jgi:hypothetical protein
MRDWEAISRVLGGVAVGVQHEAESLIRSSCLDIGLSVVAVSMLTL